MIGMEARCPKCDSYLHSEGVIINDWADSYDKYTLANYFCPNKKCKWYGVK